MCVEPFFLRGDGHLGTGGNIFKAPKEAVDTKLCAFFIGRKGNFPSPHSNYHTKIILSARNSFFSEDATLNSSFAQG